jgi:hypothetical protein
MIREKDIVRFEPSFKPKQGFVYNGFENRSLENQLEDLGSLEKDGLVSSINSLSVLRCPDCTSYAWSCKLLCQACGSGNLHKGSVIEHIPCGNVDFDENYQSNVGKLLCRKCNKRLNAIGVDYSRPGYFYRCMSCKALLPGASEQYVCLGCGRQSKHNELTMLRLPICVVNMAKVADFAIGSEGLTRELSLALSVKGIDVLAPASLKGTSQIAQKFALVVYDKDRVPILICDKADEYQSAETTILSLFAKSIDVGVKRLALLSSGELEEKAMTLASAYGIKVILIDPMNSRSSVSAATDQVLQIVENQNSSSRPVQHSEA